MKRITALVTALICVFALSACESSVQIDEQDAKAAIVGAMEKQGALKQVDATSKAKVNVSAEGMSQTMDANLKIKGDFRAGDSYGFSMEGKASMMGISADLLAYYRGGYIYTSALGMKIKEKVDIEEAAGPVLAFLQKNVKYTADMLTGVTAKKAGGNTVYSFSFDRAKTKEILKMLFGSLAGVNSGLQDIDDSMLDKFELQDMSGSVAVNGDGYIVNHTLHVKAVPTEQGAPGAVELNFEIAYNNPGADVQIKYPADLDTYTEGEDWDFPIS